MSFTDTLDYEALARSFLLLGSVVIPDQHGKNIMIAKCLEEDGATQRGIMLAWEGQGAFFWRGHKSLNRFQLVDAGFSGIVAPTLVRIVSGIMKAIASSKEFGAAIPQRLLTAESHT